MKRSGSDERGTVFVVVAMAIPVILLVLALSIDLSGAQSVYSDHEAAVESAAGAAAEYISKARMDETPPTDTEINGYALRIMESNLEINRDTAEIIPGKFSATIRDEHVVVASCMSVKGSGIAGSMGFGSRMVCSGSSAAILCMPREVSSTGACPAGQTGTIQYMAVTQCPSGITGTPMPVSNDCSGECTPNTTRETKPCPEGLAGAGITMTMGRSCPDGALTTAQTSYSCKKPCSQPSETRTLQCTQVLNDTRATGEVEETRTTACPSGAWGGWIQTKYGCCVPETETRIENCPAGKTGSIRQEREKGCPADQYGDWKTVGDTCENEPDGYKVHRYDFVKLALEEDRSRHEASCPWKANGRNIEYHPALFDYQIEAIGDPVTYRCATSWRNQHDHSAQMYGYAGIAYVKYKYVKSGRKSISGSQKPLKSCSCDFDLYSFGGDECIGEWYTDQDEGDKCYDLVGSGRGSMQYNEFQRVMK